MKEIRSYKIILTALIGLISLPLYSQDDCTLKLNQAQKFYEEGKIETVPPLLLTCLENGFNKENKITALRLLALVELFEDNQEQAEQYLLKILKINPEYTYNEAIDPIEYIRLYQSINTDPIFSIGGTLGFNIVKPHLITPYSTNDFYDANDQYASNGIGLHIGVIGIYHVTPKIDIAFEPVYSSYSFNLQEDVPASKLNNDEKISYLEFPLIGKYYFYTAPKASYFAELGFCYGSYMSGSLNLSRTYPNNERPPKTGSSIDSDGLRNDYDFSGIIGVGTKMKLNRSNVQFSLRYQVGMVNVMYTPNRNSNIDETTTDYYFVDNNFSLNTISFHLSYNYEFYRHKKK